MTFRALPVATSPAPPRTLMSSRSDATPTIDVWEPPEIEMPSSAGTVAVTLTPADVVNDPVRWIFKTPPAIIMWIALLLTLSIIVGLTAPLVTLDGIEFSGRDLILIGGGLFFAMGFSVLVELLNVRIRGRSGSAAQLRPYPDDGPEAPSGAGVP